MVQVEIAHSPLRSEGRKYRACILMMPGKEERVITISFPVFSSDRNINIIRDNWISAKSGGGAEAGGRSVKSMHTQKAKPALERGHSALKQGLNSLTRACSWGACCCFVPGKQELPAVLWHLNRLVSDKLYLDLMGNQAGIPSSPWICWQRRGLAQWVILPCSCKGTP